MNSFDIDSNTDIAWCPGCGNFQIRDAILKVLDEMAFTPGSVVFVSGIGQAAKMPQYLNVNYFNGLHGRALPVAVAVKMANPQLTVIAEGGDGDMYGEGGNHLIHNIRRNPDITHLVHNNMIYGLTKGQASPTTRKGFETPVQINGVTNEPFNPLSTALCLGATFVARCFSGDTDLTQSIIRKAVEHEGYALVDIFHPCVSFNKVNNYKWYKNNTYYIDDTHDATDKDRALQLAMQNGPFPLGILHQKTGGRTFEQQLSPYKNGDMTPLHMRDHSLHEIEKLQFT